MTNLITIAAAALLVLAAFAGMSAHAAYIRLDDSKPVCFVEEVTYGSELIIFQYTRKMYQSTQSQNVLLTVTSPVSKTVVANRDLSQATQILTFSPVAAEIGEYQICLQNPVAEMFGSVAVGKGVEIEVLIDHQDRRMPLSSAKKEPNPALRHKVGGEEEVFVFTDSDGQAKEALRTHDYLDRVTHHLNTIEKFIEETTEEVHYFKTRQERMRQTSESSFTRVWGFSALSIGMLTAVALIQFFSLRSFLKAKKVV